MSVPNDLPTDLTVRYRYSVRHDFRFGKWEHSYELVGAKGAVNLHISGPHKYGGTEHWSAGLELHSRIPLRDSPPDHDECWLLHAPCWHDGTSSYAQEHFLPMFFDGDHGGIFRDMIDWADKNLPSKESER